MFYIESSSCRCKSDWETGVHGHCIVKLLSDVGWLWWVWEEGTKHVPLKHKSRLSLLHYVCVQEVCFKCPAVLTDVFAVSHSKNWNGMVKDTLILSLYVFMVTIGGEKSCMNSWNFVEGFTHRLGFMYLECPELELWYGNCLNWGDVYIAANPRDWAGLRARKQSAGGWGGLCPHF
jgi:hypothetical protein